MGFYQDLIWFEELGRGAFWSYMTTPGPCLMALWVSGKSRSRPGDMLSCFSRLGFLLSSRGVPPKGIFCKCFESLPATRVISSSMVEYQVSRLYVALIVLWKNRKGPTFGFGGSVCYVCNKRVLKGVDGDHEDHPHSCGYCDLVECLS